MSGFDQDILVTGSATAGSAGARRRIEKGVRVGLLGCAHGHQGRQPGRAAKGTRRAGTVPADCRWPVLTPRAAVLGLTCETSFASAAERRG
ncbi:hypothetical protein [Streptomyces sp. NPDC021608]|uniref:hypothetical protein n=1 Tax=Streptomyces sp. NPDC021608 TaxID=3154903 RepID=UPI0033FF92A3